MKYSRRPFTLVELLVTISIIAVLAAVLLPAIRSAMRAAKEGKAKTEINSLITAMQLYESEYDIMPIGYDQVEDDTTASTAIMSDDEYRIMISFLSQTGDKDEKEAGNARKLKILTVKKAAEYLDPWKNRYHVVGDVNSDDSIAKELVFGMYAGATGDKTLPRSVIVWSRGADKKYDPDDPEHKDNRDNIYSVQTNWDKARGHVIP